MDNYLFPQHVSRLQNVNIIKDDKNASILEQLQLRACTWLKYVSRLPYSELYMMCIQNLGSMEIDIL